MTTATDNLEEFRSEEIERLQEQAAQSRGFVLTSHTLRLEGFCRACAKKPEHAAAAGKAD